MNDWLGLDWWRYAWIPALSAGLIWLASTWKSTAESRTARDARLDGRQERELTRLDAENDELRVDRDRGWSLARWWHGHCHEQRHTANNVIMRLGGTHADRMPELPAIEDPIPRRKPPTD